MVCRAYGKAGNGNEMETGNGNRKLKTEMETIGCFASLASLASFPGLRRPQFSLALCKSLFMFTSAVFYLWCSMLSN